MDGSEGEGDLAFIQTFFALLWKLFLKNTSKHKNNLIYIIKQEGLYQNKVTLSLASIHNCKMAYFWKSLFLIVWKYPILLYLHFDPDGWPVVEVETLCGEHMRRTRHVHSQNHSHSWRQRVERSERNGEVKGEFSWLKSVFFEAIKLWEQKDQLLRKSSQIKLLKMVLESKEINKQLVIVQCPSLDRCMCFFFEIRPRPRSYWDRLSEIDLRSI